MRTLGVKFQYWKIQILEHFLSISLSMPHNTKSCCFLASHKLYHWKMCFSAFNICVERLSISSVYISIWFGDTILNFFIYLLFFIIKNWTRWIYIYTLFSLLKIFICEVSIITLIMVFSEVKDAWRDCTTTSNGLKLMLNWTKFFFIVGPKLLDWFEVHCHYMKK